MMKNIFLAAFLTVCFLFLQNHAYTLSPQDNDLDKEVDRHILTGMKHLYDGKYKNALDSFQNVIDLVPENPAGHFYYAAALESIMKDYLNYNFEDDFYKHIKATIVLAEKMIKKNKKDPMAHLYLGAAYGYRGIYNAAHGSFFQAFIDGSKGYKMLKKTIELEPELYDAYFGIGVYEFYKTYYLEQFFWLKNSEFTKEESFNKVLLSAKKAKYCKQEAEFSLLTLYFSDERYEELVKKAEEMKPRFPNKITLYTFLSPSYYGLNQYEKSLKYYEIKRQLLKKSAYSKPISYIRINFFEIVIHYNQGKISTYQALEKTREYLKNLQTIKPEHKSEKSRIKVFKKMAEEFEEYVQEQLEQEEKFF